MTRTRKSMRAALAVILVISPVILTSAFAAEQKRPQRPSTEVARADLKPVVSALPVVGGAWTAQGPAPIYNGTVENIPNRPVAGAINAVVTHPTNPDIIWIGSVNGGIWKTTNATAVSPTWTPVTDSAESLSISDIALDPTDTTGNTLVAGTAPYSSFYQTGGPAGRLLRTTNGGTTWAGLSNSLAGIPISGIAARGSTILVSTAVCTASIYRSTDTGASFSAVSGLPGGSLDITGPPNDPAILYAAVNDCSNFDSGIYKSTDTGATWTRMSNSTMNALLNNATNVVISAGEFNQVFVGIVTEPGDQLAGLFRSGNGGSGWTQLPLPTTTENGTPYGLHTSDHGELHFSLAADPVNTNLVYVGGDAQTGTSLGSLLSSGRLFRVNADPSSGPQVTSLTHCPSATSDCFNRQSTRNNSAPHADSRDIAFDASGNLIQTDDGGIYRRRTPSEIGDWESLNGNLQITEIHSVGYDRISNAIMGGSQDNGTSEQAAVGSTTWDTVSGGDGGIVGVDDVTRSTQSTRYSSHQNLDFFYRRSISDTGVMMAYWSPQRIVNAGGASFVPQFYTPVALNQVDPRRILFAGANDLYESLDRGDTITALGLNKPVDAMAYGGRAGGIEKLDLIWAISRYGLNQSGPNVYRRASGGGAPVQTSASPGTSQLRDIAVDIRDWNKAYVVNSSGQVWATSNAGGSWTNITGNLPGGTNDLWSIVHIPANPNSVIVVGGANGVFRTSDQQNWNQLGSGMSNAIVYDLEYDAFDDTLVAGTLGRGVWKLTPVAVSGAVPSVSISDVTATEGNAGTSLAAFNVSLSAAANHTVAVNYTTTDGTALANRSVFSNTSPITIPTGGNATPFPSEIAVAGLADTVSRITATLSGFSHTRTKDVDIVLESPDRIKVVLMSDVGGAVASSGINLTFDDRATAYLPQSALSPGTYRPTNFEDEDDQGWDFFTGFTDETVLAAFDGAAPNGMWKLHVVDDYGASDNGSFSGGWSLAITTSGGDYNFTSGTLIFDPGVTTRTISVPVQGDTANEPNETFFVNLSGASNATLGDAQGQATIMNDDPVPPTNVVATAITATSVSISWTAAIGAASYRVYRSGDGLYFVPIGDTPSTTFTDVTAAADTSYFYKVHSVAEGIVSAESNADFATTVIFTDPGPLSNVAFKLAHFTELLRAVNAMRRMAGLAEIAFSPPAPGWTVTARVAHVVDLRSGLDAARTALFVPALTYTDPNIAGSTRIKAVHIEELRAGVR